MSGCASVELSLPGLAADPEPAQDVDTRQRTMLNASLGELRNHPWSKDDHEDDHGITGLIFGAGAPSARSQAEDYIDGIAGDRLLQVRNDLDETLVAVWNVANAGRAAALSMQPLASDLRTIENAIVEARRCRLVYSEALTLLGRLDEEVTRNEVRRVKQRFNDAILELGRTADALSLRLQREPGSTSYVLSRLAR